MTIVSDAWVVWLWLQMPSKVAIRTSSFLFYSTDFDSDSFLTVECIKYQPTFHRDLIEVLAEGQNLGEVDLAFVWLCLGNCWTFIHVLIFGFADCACILNAASKQTD